MHQSVRQVGSYISAFAEEALADSLQRLLACTARPNQLGQAPPNQFSLALAATAAAHGAELLIKSAIATEHPLLLFDSKLFVRQVPKDDHLELTHLFERETITFQNLPYALWAATSFKLPLPELFDEFRRLRNKIEHFCVPPNERVIDLTLKFLFSVIDPVLRKFWGSDLLGLMRPFGVTELLGHIGRLVPNYNRPEWLNSFNEREEQQELADFYAITERQSQIAAADGKTYTQWCVQMSVIVPAARKEMAGREAMRIVGELADSATFSVPLGQTRVGPATHYGAHTSANKDMGDRLIRMMRRHEGYWSYSCVNAGTPAEEKKESFDALCARLGLTRVQQLFEPPVKKGQS
jgi:hypothetical protein